MVLLLMDGLRIHVCLGKVEVCNAKQDGAVTEVGLQNLRANLLASQGAEVVSAKPAGEVIVCPDAIDHHARCLGKLNVESNVKHDWSRDVDQPGKVDGAGNVHVANILLAPGRQWTIGHSQEDGWVAGNRGVLDDCAG